MCMDLISKCIDRQGKMDYRSMNFEPKLTYQEKNLRPLARVTPSKETNLGIFLGYHIFWFECRLVLLSTYFYRKSAFFKKSLYFGCNFQQPSTSVKSTGE